MGPGAGRGAVGGGGGGGGGLGRHGAELGRRGRGLGRRGRGAGAGDSAAAAAAPAEGVRRAGARGGGVGLAVKRQGDCIWVWVCAGDVERAAWHAICGRSLKYDTKAE